MNTGNSAIADPSIKTDTLEKGWIIQGKGLNLQDVDETYYFTVYLNTMTWSRDQEDAVRFLRQRDAEEMIFGHNFFNIEGIASAIEYSGK